MAESAASTSRAWTPRIVHILFGGLGGHGSVVFSLIKASEGAAVHELAFVSTGELLPEYRDRCEDDGITYMHERTSGGADVGFQWRLFRWVLERRPDTVVVHSTGSVGAALAVRLLRRRTRVVVVEHQSWELRGRRYDFATTLSLLAADQILVLNEDYVGKLRTNFPRLSRRTPIDVVRNGIDTEAYAPATQRSRPPGPVLIGMQSRIIPIKDHATLIRAVHRLRNDGLDVRLEMAGDGSSRADLEALVRELDLSDHVAFLGMLGEPELVRFLQRLDLYVHASRGEAMSTALLQAMSCRLPVVASDVPGISDLVGGAGTAVLVPPQNPDSLAEAVTSLWVDPEGRERLAATARAFVVTGYSLKSMWESYGPHVTGRKDGTLQRRAPVLCGPAASTPMESLLNSTFGARGRPELKFWPGASHPRVAFQTGDHRVARWFQRSGLLGGGSTPVTRAVLRSMPLPLLLALRGLRERSRRALQ